MGKPDDSRLERYERVHFRGAGEQMSNQERVRFLTKKKRGKVWMFVLNLLAILFFSYSWINDLTSLSDTLFFILLAVFALNVFLIRVQWSQIRLLLSHYQRIDHSDPDPETH